MVYVGIVVVIMELGISIRFPVAATTRNSVIRSLLHGEKMIDPPIFDKITELL